MDLDRGTKIYAAVLGGILLLVGMAWLLTLDFRVGDIERMLHRDPKIAAYPYPFRALGIEGKTALISTPRTSSMPGAQTGPQPGGYR
ncbi:MAG: hypothetical protein KZQ97_02980 [Candidatus Thiodiazotropha sp. (ex Dulcina madagascariensis)]|nr:hypothetical protein [Candidatus Thiodiazotropha sp. (ex Dulcina madagascariensis)]